MPAIITTSSALVYGSYENIFLLLFFIITIILHLQYSVHTKYLPHGVCVCAGGGGGVGDGRRGPGCQRPGVLLFLDSVD